MDTSSFLTSARVANSKLAAKLAGYRVCVGCGQAIGVKASVRRTSTTRSDRNLPAIVIIGAGRALAAFALPAAPGHARTTAGLLNSNGDRAPRGLLFFALVNSVQEPASRLTKCFRSVFVNLRHGKHHDRRKRQGVVKA